jgi:hypothetical protein
MNIEKIINNRKEVMKWWNDLSSAQKTNIVDNYPQWFDVGRRWETLTGREIEGLYHSEIKIRG